ncbi:flagellar basal body P-ring formation chaperone FlgA [Shewanella denitrificans]|nr:flagellar basal body P-ring formation chaperone FlgA [Shewanella denitrificans]
MPVGTRISHVILLAFILLPLTLQASPSGQLSMMALSFTTASTQQQISNKLTAEIAADLKTWQKQQDINELNHKSELRIPSSAKSLPPCVQGLSIEPSKGLPYGRVQRKLTCSNPSWSLYVRAIVTVTARLPVVNRTLMRSETVSATDLNWRTLTLKPADKDILSREVDIVGQQVVRKLRKNSIIKASYLDAPVLVKLGEPVIIEANSQGFHAKMTGVAMDSGKQGEPIRVKNSRSGKVITAYPISKGRVQTQF